MTPTPTTRDAVRTKHQIIRGAGRALVAMGPGASLDAMAAEAGVSKGGILHHFGTKDALIEALAADAVTSFQERVERHVDLSENRPGKTLRAYVRAIEEEILQEDSLVTHPEVWGVLGMMPEVSRMLQADSDHWREAFAADGLEDERIQIVWRAADGLMAAATYDSRADAAEVQRLCAALIRLSALDEAP
ncbi:transcriptional regulator BetI [Clavibacter michiganensis]|jgi:AcrR family transcriptional regulator|uniref:Transcriptional regulator BetI n=1 Tax=Clavibacter michiganensis TaxID=28447 RepID=A0A251Y3N9_9MICO|nr:TetR/AcrR family transcriptional regulator [Clavibacter michiganensis]OUE18912.1 transcriptional regulator BetI [Clavibacter michiganensis]